MDRALTMPPLSLRRLTGAERRLAEEMFGAGFDVARVRLLSIPIWPRAFVAGPRLIVWPAAEALEDFGDAPLGLQATFVHELAHVWQAKCGIFLPLAKLRAGDSAASYAYDLAAGPPFGELNIEQQAMIVEHAFLAARGVKAPFAAHLYAQAASAWRTI
jgi:hypothetical protein